MRFLAFATITATGICTASLAAPAIGQSESILRHMNTMYSEPDEHYFYEDDRKQVVSYKKDRVVRICADESRHLVALEVTYDGKKATLESDDCIRVEAKNVYLEPKETLDPNWVIKAEVETL